MKKFPMIVSVLLVLGVLITAGFTRPLAVRNGVVTSYSPGASITIRDAGLQQSYMIRAGANGMPATMTNGLGVGARVTVFAACLGGGPTSTSSNNGAPLRVRIPKTNNQNGNPNTNFRMVTKNGAEHAVANEHACVALAIFVRQAATGNANNGTTQNGTTGTTGTATATTTAPLGITTPMVTGTPQAGTTETATPAVTATATP